MYNALTQYIYKSLQIMQCRRNSRLAYNSIRLVLLVTTVTMTNLLLINCLTFMYIDLYRNLTIKRGKAGVLLENMTYCFIKGNSFR